MTVTKRRWGFFSGNANFCLEGGGKKVNIIIDDTYLSFICSGDKPKRRAGISCNDCTTLHGYNNQPGIQTAYQLAEELSGIPASGVTTWMAWEATPRNTWLPLRATPIYRVL